MEPEENAPEISPAVALRRRRVDPEPEATEIDDGIADLRHRFFEQIHDDLADESSSDCPSGACSRTDRSDRRQLAFKVSDYLMAMAVGALLPELIFYLSQIKKLI